MGVDDVKSNMGLRDQGSIKRKGGFRSSVFVFVLKALESMGFAANAGSLVLYFKQQLHFDLSGSAIAHTNLMGSAYLLSIFGGFVADTFIDRFKACLIFGMIEISGWMLMTIQARYKSLQADACGKSSCIHGGNAVMLYTSLALYALGTGSFKAILPALGADQFDKRNPKGAKALTSFFNWLMFSLTFGAIIGLTAIVWVSTNRGWWKGFLISLVVTLFGYCFLASGKSFFHVQKPGGSPILRIIQIIVVAIKNRQLSTPESSGDLYELDDKELVSEKIAHTNQFRCLDKAAVLPDDTPPGPWKVCTVTQVEEVKILIRMLPIMASTIIMNTCLAQLQTFTIQQGNMMNRHLGSFEVPASAVHVTSFFFMTILVPIYECAVVPFARKFTNHPSGVPPLKRVGAGLFLSIISMSVAALVEVKRRDQSIRSQMQKPIHVGWICIHSLIFGIADLSALVGLQEFYYREAPEGLKSVCVEK